MDNFPAWCKSYIANYTFFQKEFIKISSENPCVIDFTKSYIQLKLEKYETHL